ncbi:hypothetical protein [Streptococcus suis]|uniref:hypothetical protein n=1 Tax=Streptococcus suis TaxID=1307 RepID=UPI002AAEDA12|nr:hypothetical protein [Streptococcus suis]HEM5203018.1 hypothetical protein [Streptococcus suis]HEM5221609.1 hypothetical protein [Streptococcus suis]HEM5223949.1 hypothetical protein [Streptococcus suis]HEM5255522.1 hypothetical protein [Streptococcus suis]
MRTILSFELTKLLCKKSALGAVTVALLALLGLFYTNFFVGQISGYSADKVNGKAAVAINRQIAEEHTGYLSDDLMSRILNDYAKNQPDLKKKGVYSVVSHYAISELIPDSNEMLIAINQTNEVLQFDNIELKSQEQLGSHFPLEELKLGNFAPWNQLFLVSNSSYILILLLSVYLSAPLFSGDFSKKMNPLLLTTKYGRSKLTVAKLTASLLISTSLFVVFNAIILAVFAWYFGFSGWDTSVQLNLYWIVPFENIMAFPEKLTLLSTFVNLIVFQFIGLVFITAVNALVSSKTKSPLTTFSVSAGTIFVPSFLLQVFQGGLIHKLLTIISVPTSNTAGLMLQLSHQGPQGFFLDHFWTNGGLIIGFRLLIVGLFFYRTFKIITKVQR